MKYLLIITIISLLISFFKDKSKTLQALKIAWKRFVKILPAFGSMLVLVSLILYLIPQSFISDHIGKENIYLSTASAALIGSITFLPGFIVFPLAGIMLSKGVPYIVLSAFTTTLMMVGVATFPLEKQYLGVKASLLRNVSGLLIALIVALITGIIFGEIL